jgi:PIN domain nuclease of toxin-antitoxin system
LRLLLDTVTFLRLALGEHLSATALNVCRDRGNILFLSSVSAWEIAVKTAMGRLALPLDPSEFITAYRRETGIASLPLHERAAGALAGLPAVHKDPFDRMLVCQAIAHQLTIVTPDVRIRRYPVPTIW